MKEFITTPVSSPKLKLDLEVIMTNWGKHSLKEEESDLPILENTLNAEDSKRLATSFHRTRKFVPTKSYPDKPPYETAGQLLSAPYDRLKTAFDKFPLF